MTTLQTPEARTDYWRERIEAWQISGQSQQAFCKAHNLNYPRFGYWLRKFRQQAGVTSRQDGGFVPVVAQPTSEGLALRLPNGMELRGITGHNLALVEQLLNRLS
jgi:hypothetical protein